MIIHDLNVKGVSRLPDEADAVSIVDSDTVLSLAIPFEGFQPQAGKAKILKRLRAMQKR
jgi:hypothetical protein